MKIYFETGAGTFPVCLCLFACASLGTCLVQLVAGLIRCESQADSYSSLSVPKLYQSLSLESAFTLLFISSHTFLPQEGVLAPLEGI